jgi:hypothetical protein
MGLVINMVWGRGRASIGLCDQLKINTIFKYPHKVWILCFLYANKYIDMGPKFAPRINFP